MLILLAVYDAHPGFLQSIQNAHGLVRTVGGRLKQITVLCQVVLQHVSISRHQHKTKRKPESICV